MIEPEKELCDMCHRKPVCGIRKWRKFPWQECRHFLEKKTERENYDKADTQGECF